MTNAAKEWCNHYKTCDQCNNAVETRFAEATDIYDPVGGAKMLRSCCEQGRLLCKAYDTEMDVYIKGHGEGSIIY